MKPQNLIFALVVVAAGVLVAQDKPAEAKPASTKPEAATSDAAKPDASKPDASKPVDKPGVEPTTGGTVEWGYRWRSDVGGNFNSYRSVVDLGSGPKMFETTLWLADPNMKAWDRLDIEAHTWGGEPTTTTRWNAIKRGKYELRGNYRNLVYFNNLPSFANPLLDRGSLFSQRAFDFNQRMASIDLTLNPGGRVLPYFNVDTANRNGGGINTIVTEGNEYAVPNFVSDRMFTARGGVRFEYSRFHATVEQGYTVYGDDERMFQPSTVNLGNRSTSFLGQRLQLENAAARYRVRGSAPFWRGLLTGSPSRWVNVQLSFLHSRPENDARFSQDTTGRFVLPEDLTFVTQQQFALTSYARLPRTVMHAGAEIRPGKRVRVLNSIQTDRLTLSGLASNPTAGLLAQIQTDNGPVTALSNTFNQAESELLVDAAKGLTLRAGYRHIWGDTNYAILPEAGLPARTSAALRRDVVRGGASYRLSERLSLNLDLERAFGGDVYFRTSLYNHRKLAVRARYQVLKSLSINYTSTMLDADNPTRTIEYDLKARSHSMSAFWAPKDGKWISLSADYSRVEIRSDINYIGLPFFNTERSLYVDNAHLATGLVDLFAKAGKRVPRLTLGGSMFLSAGSRPSNYYQPLGRVAIPVTSRLSWVTEWRYHGFGQAFYAQEAFRAHLFLTALRITR